MKGTDRRYFSIGDYFRKRFGEKVYKISVSVAETCPNRTGPDGKPTCTFCDEWGSASYFANPDAELEQQIRTARERISRRFRAERFLVYFQAYTNTFERVTRLEHRFAIALAQDKITGLVLGTRPDCIPARLLPVLRETHERAYVMVELGAQTFFEDQLTFLGRAHTVAKTYRAIEKLHGETGVDIGIHLMFGLPGETEDHMKRTAEIINKLPISNVKLHNLHVLEKTELARQYRAGAFQPLDLETYARRVIVFLRHLSPEIAVQRLAASANRWSELIAPDYTRFRMMPTQFICDKMTEADCFQGDLYQIKKATAL